MVVVVEAAELRYSILLELGSLKVSYEQKRYREVTSVRVINIYTIKTRCKLRCIILKLSKKNLPILGIEPRIFSCRIFHMHNKHVIRVRRCTTKPNGQL